MMERKKRIVITGGVLTPAMAVIEELQKRGNWEIFYLGRKYALEGEKIPSVESQIIPKLGVQFIPIVAGRLQRRFTRYTIPSLFKIPLGFFQALFFLLKIKPQVICSFGGYVSVPTVIAGWSLRIPILTHEQTVVFGLASKINALFANKVAVSYLQSLAHFPRKKAVLAGNPIRQEIFQTKKPSWFPIIQLSNYPIIYFTGGNQGAHVINMAVVEILPKLLERYVVIHQTGERDYKQISNFQFLPQSGIPLRGTISNRLRKRYFITSYIDPEEIGWVLNKATLVISRAGANTVSELAALGKPALFIPIPWSYQDEQTKNAKMLVEAGMAEILPQKELSGKILLTKIEEMIANLENYQRKAVQVKKLVKLDAAQKIVEELYGLAQKKGS